MEINGIAYEIVNVSPGSRSYRRDSNGNIVQWPKYKLVGPCGAVAEFDHRPDKATLEELDMRMRNIVLQWPKYVMNELTDVSPTVADHA